VFEIRFHAAVVEVQAVQVGDIRVILPVLLLILAVAVFVWSLRRR